eukprot:176788-Chlamydomonas_euryale.AAC.5
MHPTSNVRVQQHTRGRRRTRQWRGKPAHLDGSCYVFCGRRRASLGARKDAQRRVRRGLATPRPYLPPLPSLPRSLPALAPPRCCRATPPPCAEQARTARARARTPHAFLWTGLDRPGERGELFLSQGR